MDYKTIINNKKVSLKSFLRTFSTKHPELVTTIQIYPGQNNPEKLFNYLHSHRQPSKCKNCGGVVSFINFRKGYQQFCGTKCSAIYRSQTQPNPASSPAAKDKIRESRKNITSYRESKKEKHILDDLNRPFDTTANKDILKTFITHNYNTFSTQIKKRNPPFLQHLNKHYPGLKISEQTWCFVHDKLPQQTCKTCNTPTTFLDYNRGYNPYCSHKCAGKDTAEKARKTFLLSWLKNRQAAFASKYKPLYTIDEYTSVDIPLPYECLSCGKTFSDHIDDGSEPACPTCFPKSLPWSLKEKELVSFIQGIYPGPITENTRKIIPPQEVDIYLPEKCLAIEFNGNYWHSHLQKSNNYHAEKYTSATQKGIQLIQIWENEWDNKQDLIKSRISAKLGLSQNTFYARKCTIQPTNTKAKQEFLDTNHIQGNCISKVNLGLWYQETLIAVMTFGKSRFHKQAEWELLRFCSSKYSSVVGGASKLFKHFLTTYNPVSVVSYSDNRWNTGAIYTKLGMKQIGTSRPNYWYFKDQKLYNRFRFQKHLLEKQLPNFDPTLSEFENMNNNGWLRLYDAGNNIFLYTKP